MKSKKSISYKTDPVTMSNAVIAATAMNISVEEVVRRAIKEFANSLESEQRTCKQGRSKAATVEIYDEGTVKILQDTVTRTALTQSAVTHKCLKKYLECYRSQIRQELESILNRLNQATEAIAA